MREDSDLRALERKVFRASFDDGLWDVLLASVVAMFAIAPFLSRPLGDLWASVIFLPVWAGVYAIIWLVRRRLLTPRIGTVRLGAFRKGRLRTFTFVMLGVNVIAMVVGVVALSRAPASGWMASLGFGLMVLVLLSVAAYFLNIPRLFAYGLLLLVAPIVGEWLWREGHVSHHGYPVAYGAAAGVIAVVGLVQLFRLLRRRGRVPHPPSCDPYGR